MHSKEVRHKFKVNFLLKIKYNQRNCMYNGNFYVLRRKNLCIKGEIVRANTFTQLLHQPLHIYKIYQILHIKTLKTL